MMIISLIAAVSENNVIGKDNDLIWHQPADMKFFRDKTMGHCVLMGRKNFDSIPNKYRPLPGRTNIVVSRNPGKSEEGVHFVRSIDEGIIMADDLGETEFFIIGGGEIYRQTIDTANKLYITRIHASFDGDTFFPEIKEGDWSLINSRFQAADEKNPHEMTFLEYIKK